MEVRVSRFAAEINHINRVELESSREKLETGATPVGRMVTDRTMLALSVKQPWATLLVHGVKTVEVRTWPTSHRGAVLIHASKRPDPRPEGWAWITTPTLQESAALLGGVIGKAELTDCVSYPTSPKFTADRGRHLNAPDWFLEQGLFGFVFRGATPIEYHAYRGSTFFFPVKGFE